MLIIDNALNEATAIVKTLIFRQKYLHITSCARLFKPCTLFIYTYKMMSNWKQYIHNVKTSCILNARTHWSFRGTETRSRQDKLVGENCALFIFYFNDQEN